MNEPGSHEHPSGEPLPQDPEPASSSGEDLASRIRILENAASADGPQFFPPTGPQVTSARTYPFWSWLDVLLFLIILAASLIGGFLAVFALSIFSVTAGISRYPFSLAEMAFLMQLLGFAPALFLLGQVLKSRYGIGLMPALHLKPVRRLGIVVGAGLLTALSVGISSNLLKLQEMDMPMNELIKSNSDLILVGIASVTFGPLFEEMIFRGFLQPFLVKFLGAMAGILATSLLFALPHGPQYGWHWQLMLVITAAGCVFGFIRWRMESTTASTIAHSAYNALLIAGAVAERFRDLGQG